MFLRLLLSAVKVERGRTLTAVLALTVVAATSSALLNLYVDVQAKLRREFRAYGANLVAMGRGGRSLPDNAFARVQATVGSRGMVVPFSYAVARTPEGVPVVLAGTDMDSVRRLNEWWSVTAWPSGPRNALVGARAAELLGGEKEFELVFHDRALRLNPAGILRTGAAEDSRVYLPLDQFLSWTGVGVTTLEISASGTPEEITELATRVAATLPEAEVRPVRQIVEAEARVLERTRAAFLAVTGVLLVTAALCVFSTLMAAVFDRRKDYALMKALGASERSVGLIVAAEAVLLGSAAALPGYLLGVGIAKWIGHASFHASVEPRLIVLPVVLAGSAVLAALSATAPILSLRKVQPGPMLRGE
ncbi:MAG: ABC transporter permease [Terriglobales bacterium]